MLLSTSYQFHLFMILTLLLQFLPGTVFAPRPVAAASCDAGAVHRRCNHTGWNQSRSRDDFRQNVAAEEHWQLHLDNLLLGSVHERRPNGRPGSGATCHTSVAPGATVDISVNMTAPSGNGHYRGNWKLRNASGGLFGVGTSGSYVFWVDINVNTSSTSGTTYDFVANYCSALWASGAGGLACPGTDGNSGGFVLKVDAPQLETGSTASMPGLVVNPQQVAGGYIQGLLPGLHSPVRRPFPKHHQLRL